jgi:hypothetical protein
MAAPMTKSILALARAARQTAERAVPRYSAVTSRHDFTQPQLVALLVVRHALDLDYRAVATLAAEWAELRRVLGLRRAPHYSTLCYAARRLEKGGPSPRSSTRPSRWPAPVASSARPRRRRRERSPLTARASS